MTDPRKTRQWQTLHRALVPPGSVCHLCGKPILFGLRRNHPRGPSLDHILPVRDYPHLALDPANCRPACFGCNSARGAGPLPTPPRHRDDW